ncbi:MAG: DUF1905 domain-containing protein [Nocardioides sp.]|nr:DUF1905 domain-containing protein [Nocardioides sp.]
MEFEFSGALFEWRGPSPFHFVAVPEEESDDIREAAPMLTYGWGVIPVEVHIGKTTWTTSLFPREGRYLVPVKDRIRKAEGIHLGDVLEIRMVAGRRD